MKKNNTLGKQIEDLEKIYHEGRELCMNGIDAHNSSDLTLILIGNQKKLNSANKEQSRTDIKNQMIISAWMYKRIKNKEVLELIHHISGYKALQGSYLDKEKVEKIAKGKKYYSSIINVLTLGIPFDDLNVSGVEKNRVKQTILTIYRQLNDYSEIKEKLIKDFIFNEKDHYKELKLSILFTSPKKPLSVIKEKTFSVTELVSLALFNALEEKDKRTLFSPIIKTLETIENNITCKKLTPSKLMVVASKKDVRKENTIKYFDGNKVKPPGLKEFIEISKQLSSVINMRISEIKKVYKEVLGTNSKIMVMDFCKIEAFLAQGNSMYEAHKKFEPDMDVSIFYRSFKTWKKGKKEKIWNDEE